MGVFTVDVMMILPGLVPLRSIRLADGTVRRQEDVEEHQALVMRMGQFLPHQ